MGTPLNTITRLYAKTPFNAGHQVRGRSGAVIRSGGPCRYSLHKARLGVATYSATRNVSHWGNPMSVSKV
jgi:hypothetical protein